MKTLSPSDYQRFDPHAAALFFGAFCLCGRATAQGSGPAPGLEGLLVVFGLFAAAGVAAGSAVLYFVGARVFFRKSPPKMYERISLIVASVVSSLLGAVAVMVIFDLR